MVRVPRNPGDFPTPWKLEALKKLPPKHRNREALRENQHYSKFSGHSLIINMLGILASDLFI